MGLEHIGDASIEAFHHPVGLGCPGTGQAMFDAQFPAQLIEFMLAAGFTLTASKQPVGEFLAVVGQDFLYLQGTDLVQRFQKGFGTGNSAGARLQVHARRRNAARKRRPADGATKAASPRRGTRWQLTLAFNQRKAPGGVRAAAPFVPCPWCCAAVRQR